MLRDYIRKLDEAGRLTRVKKEVSPEYEMASVISSLDENPVLFEKVKGNEMQVLAGIASRRKDWAMALGTSSEKLLFKISEATSGPSEPEVTGQGACQEVIRESTDTSFLPMLRFHEEFPNPYLSSSVVIIKDPETGRNTCVHRMMRIAPDKFSMRLIPSRQTHTTVQKVDGDLEAAVCIGNSPAVLTAAALSLKPGEDELSVANAFEKTPLVKCLTKDLEVPADSEIVLEGRITKELADEGPFMELTGKLDFMRQDHVFVVDKITHRKDALYHTLLPGGLEHKLLMGMPMEPGIYNAVNKVCDCINVRITPGGCSWLHAAIAINKKSGEEPKKAIEAAFKAHKSLKHCLIVDEDIDLDDPMDLEWALATRFQADKDAYVFSNQPSSSLDPCAVHVPGKKSVGSKAGLDATIPSGKDKKDFVKVKYPRVSVNEYL